MKPSKRILASSFLIVVFFTSLFAGGLNLKSVAHPLLDSAHNKQEIDVFVENKISNVLDIYSDHPGFPIYYDEWTERTSLTIADINNDGSKELLLPTWEGNIYAWNAQWKFTARLPAQKPGLANPRPVGAG